MVLYQKHISVAGTSLDKLGAGKFDCGKVLQRKKSHLETFLASFLQSVDDTCHLSLQTSVAFSGLRSIRLSTLSVPNNIWIVSHFLRLSSEHTHAQE